MVAKMEILVLLGMLFLLLLCAQAAHPAPSAPRSKPPFRVDITRAQATITRPTQVLSSAFRVRKQLQTIEDCPYIGCQIKADCPLGCACFQWGKCGLTFEACGEFGCINDFTCPDYCTCGGDNLCIDI